MSTLIVSMNGAIGMVNPAGRQDGLSDQPGI